MAPFIPYPNWKKRKNRKRMTDLFNDGSARMHSVSLFEWKKNNRREKNTILLPQFFSSFFLCFKIFFAAISFLLWVAAQMVPDCACRERCWRPIKKYYLSIVKTALCVPPLLLNNSVGLQSLHPNFFHGAPLVVSFFTYSIKMHLKRERVRVRPPVSNDEAVLRYFSFFPSIFLLSFYFCHVCPVKMLYIFFWREKGHHREKRRKKKWCLSDILWVFLCNKKGVGVREQPCSFAFSSVRRSSFLFFQNSMQKTAEELLSHSFFPMAVTLNFVSTKKIIAETKTN